MLRSILGFASIVLLAGCAASEYCVTEEFFKPRAVGGLAEFNRYFPQKIELKPTDTASVQVSLCDNRERTVLCIETYLDEGVVFQFSRPTVTFLPAIGDKAVGIPITKVTYNVICSGPKLDEATCQSSTKSPLMNGSANKRRIRAEKIGNNFFYNDEYMFSPDQAFTGATVTVALRSFRRRYRATTESVPEPLGNEFRVILPEVRVDGRPLGLPDLVFNRVTEDVCRPTNRRLSLQ